ncbi:MAG: hypothetical protein IPQ13_09900 [Holophagaceae bacterium]|nr:hypothetical protein [Holophagaceae bacterium]
MKPENRLWNGPVLVLWTTLAVGAMVAAIWGAFHGAEPQALRAIIRATARTSLALYALGFAAGPLGTLVPGSFSKYLLKNRRYLGLSFGISHLYHLAAILLLVLHGASGNLGGLAAILPGGFLYLWIFFMMATSNDQAVRWLGARRWKRLHRVGTYLIFLGFLKGFGLPVAQDPLAYGPFFALLLGLLGLRFAAWRASRNRAEPVPG